MTSSDGRTPMAGRFPWFVQLVFGLLSAALGTALALNADSSLDVLVRIVGAALVIAGLSRVVNGNRTTWFDIAFGAVLVVLGIGAVFWQGTTVGELVIVIGTAFIAGGVAGIVNALRGGRDERAVTLLISSTAIVTGVVVFFWPKLTLVAVGVVFGVWLVFTGLVQAWTALSRRFRPQDSWDTKSVGRRKWLPLIGASVSLATALAVLAASLYLYAGPAQSIDDAFYTPPTDVPTEPGVLLRSEVLTTGVPDGDQAWRILYTTTSFDGSPAVASGTVLASKNAPPGPRPVLAVAHGTVGIDRPCAPSLSANPFGDGESAALASMVSDGWVGVLTDYVGLGTMGPHGYLVGKSEAYDVLDSVRAARKLLELDRLTVVWGHSQGGHAALWTGIEAPTYAPDIDLLGVAAFAPASDLRGLAEGLKDSAGGKIISAYIAASWTDVFPELDVPDQVTAGYAQIVDDIGRRCFDGRDALANAATGSQLFEPIFPDSALDGDIGRRLEDNSPDAPIAAPVLVAQGDADTLVPVDLQRQWVESRCAAGQQIDYREYEGLDHVPLVEESSPLTEQVIEWTQQRLAGGPVTDSCSG